MSNINTGTTNIPIPDMASCCPNKCKWCVVPIKEGKVQPYRDVDDIAVDGRTNLILMDNNILASDYGLKQIEKIIERGYRVDFNQALDARLITPKIAELLAKVKWIDVIRLGCDTPKQVGECERAMRGAPTTAKNNRQRGVEQEFVKHSNP